jgi:prephenate dehydratase
VSRGAGPDQPLRVGYLGPEGTFTEEAVLATPGAAAFELVPLPTIFDTVMAVHDGTVEQALVPIENSLEGSVSATLDALAFETEDVAIIGEVVHPIRQCLIARRRLAPEQVEVVVSHPQANGQCARFIRTRLAGARVMTTSSTADAVRLVAEQDAPWAALGNRLAAEIYGCEVILSGVEDLAGNQTRFVWLGRSGETPQPDEPTGGARGRVGGGAGGGTSAGAGGWKTAIVFWGLGAEAPGWLVRCLSEFARRGVNLTRIESRPRREGLGHYIFFADLEGASGDPGVAESLEAVRGHVEVLRVLGSYRAS